MSSVDITLVESSLGVKICDIQEFNKAKSNAIFKLESIIKRFGDSDGERLKPYYLAQLIAESMILKQTTAYCSNECKNVIKMEKECAAEASTPSINNHILSYRTVKCNSKFLRKRNVK